MCSFAQVSGKAAGLIRARLCSTALTVWTGKRFVIAPSSTPSNQTFFLENEAGSPGNGGELFGLCCATCFCCRTQIRMVARRVGIRPSRCVATVVQSFHLQSSITHL